MKEESLQQKLGKAAYDTITLEWSHVIAAKRLMQVCEEIKEGTPSFYASGPLSKAKAIKPSKMYNLLHKGKNL